jgi:hypothetical protein
VFWVLPTHAPKSNDLASCPNVTKYTVPNYRFDFIKPNDQSSIEIGPFLIAIAIPADGVAAA